MLLKVIAQWRNRVETSFGEITSQMELAGHGAGELKWRMSTKVNGGASLQLTVLGAHRYPF